MTRLVAPVTLALSMACTHAPAEPTAHAAHQAENHAGHQPAHGHAQGHAQGPGGGHEMPHRFEDAQKWAEVFDDPARDAWQKPDQVVAALKLAPDDVVADLGAGTGYFTVRLAKVVPQGKVLGIDVEKDMVTYLDARARKEGLTNVQGIVCPADDAALPSGVDVVLVVDTYHHIADRVRYFAKVKEQLAPGGRLVIVDFRVDSERGPPKEFKMSAAQVEAELVQAGFVLARSHAFLPDQYFLELTRAGG